jgi:hypothetical protein
MSQEILTSLDITFGTSGGSHVASTNSVLGENRIGGDIGSLIGDIGERINFSEDAVNEVMKYFILDAKSKTNNDKTTTVKRDYIHELSLKLESSLILMRGEQVSPIENKLPKYKGPIYKFGEMKKITQSGVIVISPTLELPVSGTTPEKLGNGIYVIGRTYNTISTQIDQETRGFVVYHKGKIVEELSENYEKTLLANPQVGEGEDPEKASLKYGYTLQDLRDVFSLMGIFIEGLPSQDNIIFDSSGTAKDVLSDIAGKLGYYWYADPNSNNKILFISSAAAVQIEIEDVTQSGENLLNATYSEKIWPSQTVAACITSTLPSDQSTTFSGIQPQARKMGFYRVDMAKVKGLDQVYSLEEATSMFYTFLATNDNGENFDKLVYTLLIGGESEESDPVYESFLYTAIQPDDLWKQDRLTTKDIFPNETARISHDSSPVFGDRENAVFHDIRYKADYAGVEKAPLPKPSSTLLYQACKVLLKFGVDFFVSPPMSARRASKTQVVSDSHNISGPWSLDKKLSEIPDLSEFGTVLDRMGEGFEEFTVADLINQFSCYLKGDQAPVQASPRKYAFFAIRNEIFTPEQVEKEGSLDYKFLETDVELPWSIGLVGQFIGYSSEDIRQKIFDHLKASKVTFTNFAYDKNHDEEAGELEKKCKRYFVLQRVESGGGGGDEEDNLEYELFEYDLFNYNAPKNTKLKLQTFNGTITEVEAMRSAFSSSAASAPELAKSNSVTYLGLNIPTNFGLEVGGISVSIGSDGVQTTINKSNYSFIPPSQDIITSRGGKVSAITNVASMLTPRRRAILGL